MIWFVHRDGTGAICFAAQYEQPDYAQEQLDDTTSAELQAFLNPAPTRLQLAMQAFGAGCAIVSTATPLLNGTYGILPQDEINLSGLQSAINAAQPWLGYIRDTSGVKHTMTAAQFTPLADALLQYIAGIDAYVHGEAAALPAQPSTIP